MRNTIFLMMSLVAMSLFIFTGCIDVIRGTKNLTNISRNLETSINIYSETESVVQADKDYQDTGKLEVK